MYSRDLNLIKHYIFDQFVVGRSNKLALEAALQVAKNPGYAYNPLLIYGGVGLGKTHLMHSIGHAIQSSEPESRIVYLHSERFVADMIKALQTCKLDDFQKFYRSLDVLLIDDIQFLAGKERSQMEFLHTFNALMEGNKQIVITCDTLPQAIDSMDERLISHLVTGLTISISSPELEERIAILHGKSKQHDIQLSEDIAILIAKNVTSNIRELEGALSRVIAIARFSGDAITYELAKEALQDILALKIKAILI